MNNLRFHSGRVLKGFSLLELLVAMAILAMLMTMMFSLLGGTISLWDIGNKRIEAAQTARVGLNMMANDLRRAISDQQISYTSNGTAITNTVPFVATNNATTTIDLGGGAVNAAGSGQIFGVLATGKTNQPFEEFGYLCAYLSSDDGTNMAGKRYYLVRKSATTNNATLTAIRACPVQVERNCTHKSRHGRMGANGAVTGMISLSTRCSISSQRVQFNS